MEERITRRGALGTLMAMGAAALGLPKKTPGVMIPNLVVNGRVWGEVNGKKVDVIHPRANCRCLILPQHYSPPNTIKLFAK